MKAFYAMIMVFAVTVSSVPIGLHAQENPELEDCVRDCFNEVRETCQNLRNLTSLGPTGGWDYVSFQHCLDEFSEDCRQGCVAEHEPEALNNRQIYEEQ